MNVIRHEVVKHEIRPDKVEAAAFHQIVVSEDGIKIALRFSSAEKAVTQSISTPDQAREYASALNHAAGLLQERMKAAALNNKTAAHKAVEEVARLTAA